MSGAATAASTMLSMGNLAKLGDTAFEVVTNIALDATFGMAYTSLSSAICVATIPDENNASRNVAVSPNRASNYKTNRELHTTVCLA